MATAALIVVLVLLVGVPGAGASLALLRPGRVGLLARLTAAFGLGYLVSGGTAFILVRLHVFYRASYLSTWLIVSAAIWLAVLRRRTLRAHWRQMVDEVRADRAPFIAGAVVVVGVAIAFGTYLHVFDGVLYVYYLDGMQIASAHAVPAQTLQYGGTWPFANDKIFLDCFSAALVVLHPNQIDGPRALDWSAAVGSAVALWALGQSLGLRRLAPLLPLLLIGNRLFFEGSMTNDFEQYRSENVGRAIGFAALALAVLALRRRDRRVGLVAGLLFAAASGTHVIAAAALMCLFAMFVVAEMFAARWTHGWLGPAREALAIGAVAVLVGGLIRLSAEGAFGLEGASGPGAYRRLGLSSDPTFFLKSGSMRPIGKQAGAFYVPPSQTLHRYVSAFTGNPSWILGTIAVVVAVAVAIALVRHASGPMRFNALVAVSFAFVLCILSLLFSLRYDVNTPATFGNRRLAAYAEFAPVVTVVTGLEFAVLVLARHRKRLAVTLPTVAVVALAGLLLPFVAADATTKNEAGAEMRELSWIRVHTPCNARILANSVTAGTFEAATGRLAVLEGMGAFLRPEKLPAVVSALTGAEQFFRHPARNRDYLTRNGITYVFVKREKGDVHLGVLWFGASVQHLAGATGLLQRVYTDEHVDIYRVRDAVAPPASPLLRGRYDHCETAPIRY